MKKFLVGCAVVVVLLVTLLTGAAIFVYIKINHVRKDLEETKVAMTDLNKQHPFTVPQEDDVEAARLNDFFAVRNRMMEMLLADPVVTKLVANDKNPQLGLMDMMHLLVNLPRTLAKEFTTQLEAKKMSPDEYNYYVRFIYTTIYKGKMDGDPEMSRLYTEIDETLTQFNLQLSQAANGHPPVAWNNVVAEDTSLDEAEAKRHYDLVLDHKDELLEHPQLAFLEFVLARSIAARPGPGVVLMQTPAPSPAATPAAAAVE